MQPSAQNILDFEKYLREYELKALLDYRKGTQDAPLIYRANGHVTKQDDGLIVFVASDESPDRRGDVVKVDGWVLDNFQKNPVLMYVHDYNQAPLGTVPKVWVEGKQLLNTVKWDEADPQAAYIKGKYDRGMMKAESVGFRALEFAYQESDDPTLSNGVIFTKQELIEISAVPVPMHPLALQKAMSMKQFWSMPTEPKAEPTPEAITPPVIKMDDAKLQEVLASIADSLKAVNENLAKLADQMTAEDAPATPAPTTVTESLSDEMKKAIASIFAN